MIILTTVINENEDAITSEGILTAFGEVTKRETQMANGLIKAIESYCTAKRCADGAMFIRREMPHEDNGNE